MKKIKTLALIWLTAALVLLGFQTAFAAEEERVFDRAGLFEKEEIRELSGRIDALREKMDMDVAIVTTDENPGTAKEFADEFYEENGLGNGSDHSGVLFLIDMENGELYLSTEGKMIRYLTDGRVETILDDTYEYAAEAAFYQAAAVFLKDVETCFENGIASDQYNYDSETGKISRYRSITLLEFLVALAAAGITGFFAVAGVVREYNRKDENSKMAANFKLSYRKDSVYRAGSILADVLLKTYVTEQIIARQNNNNRSGGSGGGHSLSSGGRSTTHRSSGGRVHGGGGRKFK